MSETHYEKTDKYTRDERSNAVLNVDHEGLVAYKKKKRHQAMLDQTVDDVEHLKSDVAEIKSMLSQIVDGIKG